MFAGGGSATDKAMKSENKKEIVFCKVENPADRSPEQFGLSLSYAFEYLSAFALEDNVITDNFRFTVESASRDDLDEEVIFRIALRKPFMVGFSCSVENVRRCAVLARQIKLGSPETKIIFGGPELFAPEQIMEKYTFVDYGVSGEGEQTFHELLLSLLHSGKLTDVKGLCHRDNDCVVMNTARKPMDDLSKIPVLFTEGRADSLSGPILYESARGCPHHCTYCLWSPYPKRYFPIERVKKELGLLLGNPNVERIFIIDSDFDSDVQRAKEILTFIKKRGRPGIKVSAFLNFYEPDAELYDLVAELFHEVPIGIQTVSGHLMKALGREWFDITKFEKSLEAILARIPAEKLYIDLMHGLPDEKPGDFFETLVWCASRGLTHINFFRLSIFPGSPLSKNAAKFGYATDPEPPHLVYSSKTLTYDDILDIETMIVNYKVLESIMRREELAELASTPGFKVAVERLHECLPDYEKHFVQINESNISDVDNGTLAPAALDFLTRAIKDKKTQEIIRRGINDQS